MRSLEGKIAVVVGASRGIGKGIALELGAAGATVHVLGRTLEPSPGRTGSLSETVTEIESSGGTAFAARCDATQDDQLAQVFERVREAHGRLDVLVSSAFDAGRFGGTIGTPFWELPTSIWAEVFDVGTKSAYLAAVHGAPLMLEHGGLIVNVSGRAAQSYRYNVAYGVGKCAMDRMTADMARDLAPHGVAVVSLWPARTSTEHVAVLDAARDTGEILETPRFSGRAVVALASDPEILSRSAKKYWSAELAALHGFTDEHGRAHAVPDSIEWTPADG